MFERDWWEGKVHRSTPNVDLKLTAPLRRSESGARAFLGAASDGDSYWIKVLGNPQGDLILSAEQITSRAGSLLGAPVAEAKLIEIPTDLAGWRYGEFEKLRPGIAHASKLVRDAEDEDALLYQERDDNAARMPAIFALWDWCLGDDPQWLYEQSSDWSIWSFDHGWWLGGGPGWDPALLAEMVDLPWAWDDIVAKTDPAAFERVASRLESLSPDEVLSVVADIPETWGLSTADLETVAWVLYRRRQPVAERLRHLSASIAH